MKDLIRVLDSALVTAKTVESTENLMSFYAGNKDRDKLTGTQHAYDYLVKMLVRQLGEIERLKPVIVEPMSVFSPDKHPTDGTFYCSYCNKTLPVSKKGIIAPDICKDCEPF